MVLGRPFDYASRLELEKDDEIRVEGIAVTIKMSIVKEWSVIVCKRFNLKSIGV